MRLDYPAPPLEDGVIALRPWAARDLDCVREAALRPEITIDTSIPVPYTEAEGLAFIARQGSRQVRGDGLALAVTRAGGDRAIGHGFLGVRPQAGVVGLGYWVLPSARGHGVGSRIARLLSAWVLGPAAADRVEAWVRPENGASLAVLRAAGFTREGVLRRFWPRRAGENCDMVVLSRIRADG